MGNFGHSFTLHFCISEFGGGMMDTVRIGLGQQSKRPSGGRLKGTKTLTVSMACCSALV